MSYNLKNPPADTVERRQFAEALHESLRWDDEEVVPVDEAVTGLAGLMLVTGNASPPTKVPGDQLADLVVTEKLAEAPVADADPDYLITLSGGGFERSAPSGQINIHNYRRTGDSDWSAAAQRAYDLAMDRDFGGEIVLPPPSVSSDEYVSSDQIVCDLGTDKQVCFTGFGPASRVKLHSSLGEVGAFLVTAPSATYEGLVRFNNFSIVGFGNGSVGAELSHANGVQFTGMRFKGLEDGVRSADTKR